MKKFAFILLCIFFCFSLSSCDYTEIDTKTIVAGIAVDSDESGKLKTTFEVISPASEESDFSSILVTGLGSTIKGAIQKRTKGVLPPFSSFFFIFMGSAPALSSVAFLRVAAHFLSRFFSDRLRQSPSIACIRSFKSAA